MKQLLELLENWPFAAWALVVAVAAYFVISKGVGHLSEDVKARLELYLGGEYKGSWAESFCAQFDWFFGENHLSRKTFGRSALASIAAVAFIYTLLGPILGVLAYRADGAMTILGAMAVGAIVNILPDYLSLWETRVMLRVFQRVRNPVLQLGVLLLDLLFSGLIIWAGIKLFLLITGQPQISGVEMVALFSTFAVFFYSTFLTSVWAWAYCLSSWFVKGFTKLRLNKLLNIKAPGTSLAITASMLVIAGAFVAKPVITMDADKRVAFDAWLCETFPRETCLHAARLAVNEEQKLRYIVKTCPLTVSRHCLETTLEKLAITHTDANQLYEKACSTGYAQGCTRLGYAYRHALGVPQDFARAYILYTQGCDAGDAQGCNNLGYLYNNGLGVPKDSGRARGLYKKACEDGDPHGCTNLGYQYFRAQGVPQDYERAWEHFKQGCDGGDAVGCSNQGFMYDNALGVAQDYGRALALYKQGCDGGNANGCSNIGWLYEKALGVERDLKEAERYYVMACDMKDDWACEKLESFSQVPK